MCLNGKRCRKVHECDENGISVNRDKANGIQWWREDEVWLPTASAFLQVRGNALISETIVKRTGFFTHRNKKDVLWIDFFKPWIKNHASRFFSLRAQFSCQSPTPDLETLPTSKVKSSWTCSSARWCRENLAIDERWGWMKFALQHFLLTIPLRFTLSGIFTCRLGRVKITLTRQYGLVTRAKIPQFSLLPVWLTGFVQIQQKCVENLWIEKTEENNKMLSLVIACWSL